MLNSPTAPPISPTARLGQTARLVHGLHGGARPRRYPARASEPAASGAAETVGCGSEWGCGVGCAGELRRPEGGRAGLRSRPARVRRFAASGASGGATVAAGGAGEQARGLASGQVSGAAGEEARGPLLRLAAWPVEHANGSWWRSGAQASRLAARASAVAPTGARVGRGHRHPARDAHPP